MKGCNVGFGSPREQPRGSFLIGSGGQSETDFQVEGKKSVLSKDKSKEDVMIQSQQKKKTNEEIFTVKPR